MSKGLNDDNTHEKRCSNKFATCPRRRASGLVQALHPGDRNRAILKLMNAQELLQSAPRLSQSNCAYINFDNGDRGIIVPPGASGNHITVRACDADGNQSGPVMKVLAKELRLEPLPAPPAPLRLAPWCVNCGGPAMLRCMACGSSLSLIHISEPTRPY